MRYHFGDFTLDEAGQELRQRGEVIALEPKAFQVLCYLLQHGDRVVSRDELFAQCWPDTFVSDWALTRCVARIRKAVGDGRDGVALIKTVRGRGYRFVAPLTVTPSAAVSLPDFHAELAPPQMLPERIPLPPHTPQGEATAAERRVLTVLCCTFVDPQARQRDPEEAQALVQGYHTVCAEIIHALGGYVAQYLRAGVIAYFGVPQAHDDDAQRSVWAGLRLRDALRVRLAAWTTGQLSIQVGIHTGPAVVGELGRERPGLLAVGETPAIAERLTTLAPPGTVLISAATARLVEGYVTCQVWEAPGAAEDGAAHGVYQVLGEGTAHSRFEVVTQRGLTPLVGREAERGLLHTRWAAATDGLGQVVVIMGEPGIGKSRLVQSLADQIAGEPQRRLEWRCAPSAQYSPWHPVLAHLHRVLRWRADAPPEEKLHALEAMVATAGLALPEVVPLLASALTLPLPAHYPPLTLSPQRQKQHTLDALRRWMLAETSQHPLLLIVEDLQWSDPSTLELLTLLIDHGPTAPMLMLLTARPEFQPPWTPRAHVTPLMLGPLSRSQVAQMITQMTRGTLLPPAVVAQITAQTDGVPLFVEECTAMVLESGLLQDGSQNNRTSLLSPLAIPATLHGVLMARLDRLQPAKTIAQLGATIGRTFASEVLQAVAPLDEAAVQHGLRQLVEAELVYQHGVSPTARYMFKHALIQEAAYQLLLTHTRQQYHHRVAQVLEAQFPALVETAPELLARHYTEAGRTEQAIPYWHLAGQQARQRSANPEAARHLTQGLELLATLPASPARVQQELDLRLALGPALMATLGMGAPEVEQTYARARALCAQVGETPQLFPTLLGLCRFYRNQGALSTARELGEQLYRPHQRSSWRPMTCSPVS
jgi:DNA-binding winged helix-turn-helix (wHTH) protein